MNILVLQPMAVGGMTVSFANNKRFLKQSVVPLRGDVVVAVAKVVGKQKGAVGWVVAQTHCGSFSASRAALVVSSILSIIKSSRVLYTKTDLAEHNAVMRIIRARVKTNFSYAHPPHITMKKPHD